MLLRKRGRRGRKRISLSGKGRKTIHKKVCLKDRQWWWRKQFKNWSWPSSFFCCLHRRVLGSLWLLLRGHERSPVIFSRATVQHCGERWRRRRGAVCLWLPMGTIGTGDSRKKCMKSLCFERFNRFVSATIKIANIIAAGPNRKKPLHLSQICHLTQQRQT